MNKSQFINYIENPYLLGDTATKELDRLLVEYPFFQTAHLLHLKSLYASNSIHYNHQLKVASAYVSDRVVLSNLINANYSKSNQVAPLKTESANTIADLVLKSEQETEVNTNLNSGLESKLGKIIEDKFDELSTQLKKSTVETKVEIIETRSTENTISEVPTSEIDKVEEQPIKEAYTKPLKDIDLIYSINETDVNDTAEPNKIDAKKIDAVTTDYINKAIDASVEFELTKIIEEEKKKPVIQIDLSEKVEEIKTVELPKNLSFTDWLKQTNTKAKVHEAEKQQMLQLIDKFIHEEPRLKPKTEFFSSTNMAKKSVTLSDDIITETLAHVFVKQKNYPKAIYAYEVLIERYPDKKEYFEKIIAEVRRASQNK